jgi:hypothetical protein
MTDFGSWVQENWYQLGSFFVQCGFLLLAVWFAGKILRTLRSSQEQVGALLKLSVACNASERHSEAVVRAASEASPYWLPPTPSPVVAQNHSPEFRAASGPGLFAWWKAPMGITTGTTSFHRVLRWFQSPVNS